MVKKYPSMNSTFFVNEWNGKSILGHVVQTNQLNDRKICMNCIIINSHAYDYDVFMLKSWLVKLVIRQQFWLFRWTKVDIVSTRESMSGIVRQCRPIPNDASLYPIHLTLKS